MSGPYGNGQAGIHFEGSANDAPEMNKVLDNTLEYNATQGVWVEIGQGNKIRRNSIQENGGLGIDLVDPGVLPNDNDAAAEPTDYANRGLNYPELSARIRQHVDETKGQAARLKTCLEGLGEDTSAMKDAGGKLMAIAQSLSGLFAGDEVMKGSLASYTFEHMEIASYSILIAAANSLGETAVVEACEQNLREEEAMAEWLKNAVPRTTEQFLARSASEGDDAKR